MRKITKANYVLFASVFAAALLLLNVAWAQAQAGRLNQRQIKKLENQAVEPQSPERSGTPRNNAATPPNRPNAMQQGMQPANPRLQAIVLDRFLPRLDLSDAQKTQIQSVRGQHVRRMRTLMELERAHAKAYDEALFDLSLDQPEIEKRTAQLAEIRTDMLKSQAKLFLELRRILTAEQINKLRQIMDEERALKRTAP